MFSLYFKFTDIYLKIIEWLKSFLIIEQKVLICEPDPRLIKYNEKNLIAYIYFLWTHSWYMLFLIVLYKDLVSLYLFIFILFLILIFSKNVLPNQITEFILSIVAISFKDATGLSTKIFGYSILIILFLSSYYYINALPFLRIIFSIRTFISLVGYFYITHPSIAFNFLCNQVLHNKELIDYLHPEYVELTPEEREKFNREITKS